MAFNQTDTHSSHHRSRLRRAWPWVFRSGVVGVLVFLFHEKIHLSLLWKHFDASLLTCMLTIQPIVLTAIFLFSLRFSYLIPSPKPSFLQIFKALTLTMGLNNMLPGRISELVKPAYLKEHAGIPIRTSLAAVLLERGIDIFILGALTAVCITTQLVHVTILWVSVFLILLVCIALILFFDRSMLDFIARHLHHKLRPAVEYFIHYTSTSLRQKYFYAAVACSLGGWFLSFLTVDAFLQMSVDPGIGRIATFTVFVATVIGIAIPAIPGGFGTYEAGAVMVLGEYGIGYERALAVAIALHLGQILFYVLGAVLILTFERVGALRFLRRVYSFARSADG